MKTTPSLVMALTNAMVTVSDETSESNGRLMNFAPLIAVYNVPPDDFKMTDLEQEIREIVHYSSSH